MATNAAKPAAPARFLSNEWFDQVRALATSVGATGSVSAEVQAVVSGGPDGEITFRIVFADGGLDAVEVGAAGAADLTLTVVYDDAVAIQQGDLAPSVAFMQGRMKTAGDPGLVLHVLSATAAPEFDRLREQVNALTQY